MKKNTKILIGIGAVAVVGYLVYKQNQNKDKIFANATGKKANTPKYITYCQEKCKKSEDFGRCFLDCVNNILEQTDQTRKKSTNKRIFS